jgi:hypothetical protein
MPSWSRIPAAFRVGSLAWISGNQACIDRADRRADDPVRVNSVFVQRVVDTGLVGAERAAALQNQDGLPILLALRLLCFSKPRHTR